eukprot:Clim_evm54s22 gene=Clim_evmTU54s22
MAAHDLLAARPMQGYHSSLNETEVQLIGNLPILPLRKSTYKGPAPVAPEGVEDIVDETLATFRANVFFKNYDIQGPADRLLIYLTLYTQLALQTIANCQSRKDADKLLFALAKSEVVEKPGDSNFVMAGLYDLPETGKQQFYDYLTQVKHVLSDRLLDRCFPDDKPNKWWLSFSRRKFMNKSLRGA